MSHPRGRDAHSIPPHRTTYLIMGGLEAPINSPAEANPQVLNKPLPHLLSTCYCWT